MDVNKRLRIQVNQKFRFIARSFGRQKFKLLDVGVGNHSPSRITSLFPACDYYGLDITKQYNNSQLDFQVMKDFYLMDLTKLDFQRIPDRFFDGIWMVHVIEHLYNGDQVLEGLMQKLAPGGYMYIEYPGARSTRLPSMHGTLNFYDDHTHARVFSVAELARIFRAQGFEVLASGTRRNWYYLLATPVRILGFLLRGEKLVGNIFWDLLGFAEYLYVRKQNS
jgi:2-polyprenyl-3-methyl-5-hydroxy-6-metoxy-1,4-benzoquinol methylase